MSYIRNFIQMILSNCCRMQYTCQAFLLRYDTMDRFYWRKAKPQYSPHKKHDYKPLFFSR